MKTRSFFLFIGLLVSILTVKAQSFLNGSFETNTASGCNYNLTNAEFDGIMSYTNAFSVNNEEIDLHTNGCYVNPQDGNWCVGLACNPSGSSYDAMALWLSEPLVIGKSYWITFHSYFNTSFVTGNAPLRIGTSTNSNDFGTEIYSVQSGNANTWKIHSFVFTASNNAQFITVKLDIANQTWYQIDNFNIGITPAGIPEITSHPIDQTNICPTDDISFTIEGNYIVNHQWQVNSGTGFVNIIDDGVYSNATTATLNISDVTAAMNNYQYRCKVDNSFDTTISDAAFLIIDNESPIFASTHNEQTIYVNEYCQATLPDYTLEVEASDNCDTNLDITQTPIAGTPVSGTTNEITLTVSDNEGNIGEVKFNVIVEDTINPVISSIHNDQTIDAGTNCESILPDYTVYVIATDSCDADLEVSQSPPGGTSISGATNTITLTVTDDNGNTDEVSFNVAVEDKIDPEITSLHEDKTVIANESCKASLPDYSVDVIASDNCDTDLNITQVPAAGTIITGTTNPVILTVADDAGNIDEVTFNVLVEDTINPVITSSHNDQTVIAGTNCESILPDYTIYVEASDSCDANLEITQFPAGGTSISGATNTITLTATDDAGNFAEVSFNVAVEDNTNPSITSTHNDQTVDANENCEANLADYTINVTTSDNCDTDLEVTQSPIAGTAISGATNTITLTATDDAGNTDEVNFNIAVEDNTNPTLTCIDNQSINLEEGQTFYTVAGTEFDPTSTEDNCNVANISNDFNNSSTLDGAELPIGINTIVWTVTDDAGNEGECSFEVEIEPSGIENLNAQGISIYPNPTSGLLTLEFTNNSVNKVVITDLLGKIVYKKQQPQQKETVDFSSLTNGIYIIQVHTKDNILNTRILKE